MSKDASKDKLWVWIDPTRRCNLKCELCYTKKSHNNDDLSPSDLNIILNNLKMCPFIDIQVLHLNWRGEPLMNRNFPGLLKVVGDIFPHVPMHWHTNGMLMSKKKAEEIVKLSAPHKIYFSIDGGSKVSHDKNRGEGSFRKAIIGLKNILEANRQEKKLQIGIYQLDLKETENNYDSEFLDLCHSVDEWIRINPLLPNGDEHLFSRLGAHKGGILNSIKRKKLDNIQLAPEGPCFWAGNSMCINPKGDVSVCLLSHSSQGELGNLIREDVSLIWSRAIGFREHLKNFGRSSILHCSGCLKPCGDAHQVLKAPPQVNVS